VTVVRRAPATTAARQGDWIAAIEPWRGLGYRADALGRYLRRAGRAGQVWIATPGARGRPLGILVLQPGVLLGNFVALLAVRPEVARTGIGGALMSRAESETFGKSRWLFVSADATNRGALRFYRKLGFARVGRMPGLVREGRTEILLRKGRTGQR
jgi:ribosomal protein S18 acetylase RimI-like enzyme